MTATDVSRGTDGPDVLASLRALLTINTDMRDTTRRLERIAAGPSPQPSFVKPAGTALADANGFAVVDLGGPDMGYRWEVLRWIVSGSTVGTDATGVADLYVTATALAAAAENAALTPSDWMDHAFEIPLNGFYSHDQITMVYPERAVVVFSTATEAQQYVTAITAENIQDAPNMQVRAV